MLALLIASVLSTQAAQSSPRTELNGTEIIKNMKKAVRDASPFHVVSNIEAPGFSLNVSEISAMQPNLFSMTTVTKAPTGDEAGAEYHWTGAKQFTYIPGLRKYLDQENEFGPVEYQVIGLESAFSQRDIYEDVKSTKAETFSGKNAIAIEIAGRADFTIYVDKETYLPLGYSKPVKDAYNGETYVGDTVCTVTYKEFIKKAKLKAKDFEWNPPQDATRFGG